MGIVFKKRQFYSDELRLLKALKTQKEKQSCGKVNWYYYLIAGFLGSGCTYIAAKIPDSFWTFFFGIIAVFAFAFIVFTPYETYKLRKHHKGVLQQLNAFIAKGEVNTCHIKTEKIAFAPEYEDESDLYIIELNKGEVLYVWDIEYNLNKMFPCFDFEIYESEFSILSGRQLYPLSDRIKPLVIDKKAKWNYMIKFGSPENFQIEKKNFSELINEFTNCS